MPTYDLSNWNSFYFEILNTHIEKWVKRKLERARENERASNDCMKRKKSI